MSSRRNFHARYVLPMIGEPIENGFVGVEDGRIAAVGKTPPSGEIIDLGNAALLPGFINAHTHLELSNFRSAGFQSVEIDDSTARHQEKIRQVGTLSCEFGFVDWIRQVIAWKIGDSYDPSQAIADGLRECAKEGVTSLANISQLDEPDAAFEIAAEGVRFFELIAPDRDRISRVLDSFRSKLCQRSKNERSSAWRIGLSPHAPYSVHPELLQQAVDLSNREQIPLAMHLAESREEMQLLREGTGQFRDFLEDLQAFDPAVFPGGKRPLDYLKVLALASRAVVVHGNYLDDEEIEFLAHRSQHMGAVYCPRTHAFFRHDPYPLEKLLDAGVSVALGTDSRASSPDLSLLAEMRLVAKQHPRIDPERILRLGTLDTARLLGVDHTVGSLEIGKAANFAVVELPSENFSNPFRTILGCENPLLQTYFHGQKVFDALF